MCECGREREFAFRVRVNKLFDDAHAAILELAILDAL